MHEQIKFYEVYAWLSDLTKRKATIQVDRHATPKLMEAVEVEIRQLQIIYTLVKKLYKNKN